MGSQKYAEPASDPTYHPLPPDPQPQQQHHHHQYYVLLPLYNHPTGIRRRWRRGFTSAATLGLLFIALAVAIFFLWPSDPYLQVVRLRLNNVQVRLKPKISLDISLGVTVKVRNPDVYSMDYDSLKVSIGYRGEQLGFVTSQHGHLNARGSSYVDAMLDLDGVEVLSDAILLIEDLARGLIQLDTLSEVRGKLGLLFFKLPLKAKISCEVYVDTRNQTIVRQNCHPE